VSALPGQVRLFSAPALDAQQVAPVLADDDNDRTSPSDAFAPFTALLLGVAFGLSLWLVCWLQAPLVVRIAVPLTALAVALPVAVLTDPGRVMRRHRRRRVTSGVAPLAVAVIAVILLAAFTERGLGNGLLCAAAAAVVALTTTDLRFGSRRLRIACFCSGAETATLRRAMRHHAIDLVYYNDLSAGGSVSGDGLNSALRCTRPDVAIFGARQLSSADYRVTQQIAELYAHGTRVRTLGEFIEEFGGRVPTEGLAVRWFLHDVTAVHKGWYRAVRAVVDALAGVVLCVLLLLLLPFVALAIKLDTPGPVFYRQVRVGHQGKLFRVVKLRTMVVDAERGGMRFAARNDDRITRVGAFLRRSRLDELPQAWNLLKGEMTLIGPRPERPEFVTMTTQHTPFYGFRHIVRPGLTGWAQITEGYTSDLAGTIRKLERDLYYLRHQGLQLDLRIAVETVRCMAKLGGR
jgi:lipopolysaccharide/colanic/teichoic acid biosynthesis glycosyltransferase